MISLEITHFNQWAHIGDPNNEDNIKDECTNTITFDSENLIITANDECAILFTITPTLIQELEILVAAMRSEHDRLD